MAIAVCRSATEPLTAEPTSQYQVSDIIIAVYCPAVCMYAY